MKHRIYLLIAILLIIPGIVMADTLKINCPKTVNKGMEFGCDIYCNTKNGVTDITSQIKLSDNLTYVTFNKNDNFLGDIISLQINFYGKNQLTGNFKIGVLKLKGNSVGNATVSVTDTELFNGLTKDASLKDKTISTTVKIAKPIVYVPEEVNTPSSGTQNNNKPGSTSKPSNGGTTNNQQNTQSKNNTTNNNNNNTTNNNNNNTTNNNTPKVEEKKEEEVTEEEYEVDFTKGAYLSNLEIEGYNIDFRSDIFEYDLKIKDEKELKIKATGASDKVKYRILNNKDLKDGSVITIETTYDEEEIQNYYINISKEEKEKKKFSFTTLLIIIIVLLILVNVVRMFIKKRDENADSE